MVVEPGNGPTFFLGSFMTGISQALQTALIGSSTLDISAWEELLSSKLVELKAGMHLPSCAPQAFEVAQAFEHCVVGGNGAITGYVLCYRADPSRLDALARACQLSEEAGDFATKARLARLQYKQDGDVRHLVVEGIAWLDARQPDRAVKPLTKASREFPDSDVVASALRTARREWPKVREEVARVMEIARRADSPQRASNSILQAARMLGMLQTNQVSLEKLLLAALAKDPENGSALGMLEQQLAHLEDPDAILGVYEARLANRRTAHAHVDELRRAGMRLFGNGHHHSLGVRLVHRALSVAYQNQLTAIPGHLGMLSLMREHYEDAQMLDKFLEVIESALAHPLPEFDVQYLALQGLEVSLLHLGDEESARAYATLATAFAPRHPLVVQARERGLVGASEASLDVSVRQDAVAFDAVADSGVGELAFLDSLDLAPAPPLIGQQVSLHDQLSAASKAADGRERALELSLDLEAAPAASETFSEPPQVEEAEFGLVDLEESEPEFDDALDFVELPDDGLDTDAPLDLVELPELELELELELDDSLDMVELPDEAEVAAESPEAWPAPRPAPKPPKRTPTPAPIAAAPKAAPIAAAPKAAPIAAAPKAAPVAAAPKAAPIAAPKPAAALGKISLIPASAMSALRRSAQHRNKEKNAQPRPTRLTIPITIEFRLGDELQSISTRDVSEKGAFLITAIEIPMDAVLDLEVKMPVSYDSLRTETMRLEAKVERSSAAGYAVLFVAPTQEFKTRLTELISQQ